MKKMLINATQEEEVRIALVDDKELLDLDIEQRRNDNKKSNIYIGKISRIESSLEACFVDYGEGRDGFLPFKDIHESYFLRKGSEIKDRLEVGQKLIVQVAREERGNKGAALTTYIAIASTFLVLMPNSPEVDGISRRLSASDRDNLRAKLAELNVPEGQGLIVRTAGVGCSSEELKYDLKILHFIWDKIQEYAEQHDEVGILHHESETIIRVIRDYLTKDVGEIVVDSQEAYEKAEHYLRLVRPKSKPILTLFRPDKSKSLGLFAAYDIERQIDTAFERTVKLKSGGAIVIDTTEALTAIDVNSSRFTQGGDIESTALYTNLEAAEEIARQLKIRDLGGLIVIDFIDMSHSANQKKVEEKMRQATADDRARIQTSRISKFGLMEVSRQRIRGSIAESNNHLCPRCNGTGFIRDNESLSLHILRQIVEEVNKRTGRLAKLHVVVPNVIAAYLLNEKREDLTKIQQTNNVEIIVVPDADMQTPHFEIHRVRRGDQVKDKVSYFLVDHYQEVNRLNQRKQNAKEKNEEKSLPHNLSSVPDAYVEKTFESRLGKADFIQEALEREEKEKTFVGRIKRWFVNLFTFKKKESSEEVSGEDKQELRRRKRRKRENNNVNQETQEAKDSKSTSNNADSEKQLSKRQQRRLLREQKANARANEENEVAKTDKETGADNSNEKKAKVLADGHITEEVFTSNKERKRKAKKVIEKSRGDINPAEIKAQVEAQEKEANKQEDKVAPTIEKSHQEAKTLVSKAEEAKTNVKAETEEKSESLLTKAKTKARVVENDSSKEESRKEKRKKVVDVSERYVLRNQEFALDKDTYATWLEEDKEQVTLPSSYEVLATDSEEFGFSRKKDKAFEPSNRLNSYMKVAEGKALNSEDYVQEVKTKHEIIVKTELSPEEKVTKLRKIVFQAPQPCVNFKHSYKEIQQAKRALREQRAKLIKLQNQEEKRNKGAVKSVPVGSIPGKLKNSNKDVLESATKVKESSISKNLRSVVNTIHTPLEITSINSNVAKEILESKTPEVTKEQESNSLASAKVKTQVKDVHNLQTSTSKSHKEVGVSEVKAKTEVVVNQPAQEQTRELVSPLKTVVEIRTDNLEKTAQKAEIQKSEAQRTEVQNSLSQKEGQSEEKIQTVSSKPAETSQKTNLFANLEVGANEDLQYLKQALEAKYNEYCADKDFGQEFNIQSAEEAKSESLTSYPTYKKLVSEYSVKKKDEVVATIENIRDSFVEIMVDALMSRTTYLGAFFNTYLIELVRDKENITTEFYEKELEFYNHYLVIIDEQFRFEQGEALKNFNQAFVKAWFLYKELVNLYPELVLHVRVHYFVEEQYILYLKRLAAQNQSVALASNPFADVLQVERNRKVEDSFIGVGVDDSFHPFYRGHDK
ncbi:Rne/Rng family ribonuclease [Psittacicella gerlachiana]|uniref:Ribonuclease G n=1 Tax=Psittacicella gerlachiana TaxID=2028574 RepID=A0A3A1YBV4_9GAMM|nr:Rne/Rng family ribonuclease [Psittacicella gerlachiana]RIY34658.1 hypothetical protein CKF59_05110 [Psittacicella gerlachiana]